jgi:hypothetical protein
MAKAIGSAGELIVQARLLVRGWTTGNVNTGGMMNAPAIDLLAMKGSRKIAVAVKTTGHRAPSVQWQVKPGGWTTLFKGDERPDFVVFVWFTNPDALDDCRVFVVPAQVVDADVLQAYLHWHNFPKRDGSPVADKGYVVISWTGNDTERDISRGFAEKWAKYENAWSLLDSQSGETLSAPLTGSKAPAR